MPYTIHEEAMKKQSNVNIMRPQEPVPEILPLSFGGTMSQGLPVKQIPHQEFPRVVYMHPNEPTREIEHRNDKYELVGTEVVASEHLSKTVANAAELEAALAEGWVKEPYIPKPLPRADAHLYGPKKKKPA